MTIRIIVTLFAVIGAFWLYVRFAPTDAARWHHVPETLEPGDTVQPGGFRAVRRISAPDLDVLKAVEQRALATPRTVLLAGSVEQGMITFQTRTRLWGFPDQTTVAVQNDLLVIYGRLRFGSSDFGVNKARIESWLEMLGPLTEPL